MASVYRKGQIKMNKTKRMFWGFLTLDYKAIETYLEEMAQKGWMLEKIGRWTAKFRAIEPKKPKFYVDVFKEGGPYAPENTKEAEEYRSLCKVSGWNFITSRDYLQFFCAEEGENPTPIQTDDALEQKIVESTLLKTEIVSIIVFIIITIYMMTLYFPNKYKYLLSFIGMAGAFLFPLLTVSVVSPVIYSIVRTLKARRNVNRGLPIEKPTLESARKRIIITHGTTLVITIIIALAIIADWYFRPDVVAISLTGPIIGTAIGLILRYFIKRKGTDKKDSVLYVTFAILGVLFLSAILNSLLSGLNIDSVYKNDTIPEGYPIVTLSDLSGGSQTGILVSREFNAGMSPVTPKHYSYYEFLRNDNGLEESLNVRYYKTINPRFALTIFNGIVSELREGIKWKGMTFLERTIISDDKMKDLWRTDNLALTKERDEIIVQKGNIVVRLFGDIDFEDRYIRELIIDRFFTN